MSGTDILPVDWLFPSVETTWLLCEVRTHARLCVPGIIFQMGCTSHISIVTYFWQNSTCLKNKSVRQCHPENTFSDDPTYCEPTSTCTQARIQKFFKEGLRRKILKEKYLFIHVSTRVHINNRQPCNSFSLLLFQEDCLLFFCFVLLLSFIFEIWRGVQSP